MFRSVSTSRVSDDTYYSIYSHSPTSKAVSPALRALALEANELPQHESSPFSTLKKDKLGRPRFPEKSVHIIPLILLVCALVLWLFSNPDINMSIKNDLIAAKLKRKAVERDADTSATFQIQGSQAEGDFGISKHEESKKLATNPKYELVVTSPSQRSSSSAASPEIRFLHIRATNISGLFSESAYRQGIWKAGDDPLPGWQGPKVTLKSCSPG
ncbi:hypothetical protein L1987_35737 [Smallanthus sonchifolius]|uniref:Uncharacterized protein n=1 Tax=Smallanthus sonchifolius TaxID=185202 RepID=A0ACB9HCF3_9ASTR|nr:hypothetical protein L1987_35737 [Smallanthus sonchifolius]